MNPKVIKVPPTYIKESGLWSLNLLPETVSIPGISTKFTQGAIVQIPSRQFGGNHKHPRIELFAALTEGLELVWIDDEGKKRSLLMRTNHETDITFYLIPATTPHAVSNSSVNPGFLLEFASDAQHDVEAVGVI